MGNWTSAELVEEMASELALLKKEGHGSRSVARIIEERTGRPCSRSVAQLSLERLGLSKPYRSKGVAIVDRSPPDSPEDTVEDLIQSRVEAFERKARKASHHSRTLELPAEPVGIFAFGDPHVDNEGCDWKTLLNHVEMARATEGVMGVCVGDMTDNWVGRLAKLYAKSSVTASDGWKLSRWFLNSIQWLSVIGGNHDEWAHGPGVDPLKWISEEAEVFAYAPDEV